MERTTIRTDDVVPMPCAFCPQSAHNIDSDGNIVCHTHWDEPIWMALPGAMPQANYRYLGRTRTRERIKQNWPNSNPLVTHIIDGYFYTWQLLPRSKPAIFRPNR